MKKNILSMIALTLFICFADHASANYTFSIDERTIAEKQEADKTISKEESRAEISVEIGDNFISVAKNNFKSIYDFENKRIYTLDLSQKRYSEKSLFSDIGFREYEFKNRLMLGQALAAGDVKDNPMLPILSEHLFSLQQKDKKSKITQTTQEKTIDFAADGKALLSYSRKGYPVSRKDKEMFVKFFRYGYAGHPQVLDKILSDNIIPDFIRIHRYNMRSEVYQLSISRPKATPDRSFSLKGYASGAWKEDKDPLFNHISKLQNSNTINLEKHLEMLLDNAVSYFKEGNYLDTMLAYSEYNLASGLPFPPVFREQLATLMESEDVLQYVLALKGPKTKDEAKKMLAALNVLEEKSLHRGYVVKITKANIQTSLGNRPEAKKLFLEVITASPHITGVYINLGKLLFDEYNAVMAWQCWDMARKIAPEHPMLTNVTAHELRLEKTYPEFF